MHERTRAQIMSIFGEAVEYRSPDERAAFLDRACGGDPDRRTRLEALLQAARGGRQLPARRPASAEPRRPPIEPVAERPGTVIGPYKLLEQIGEGGMGVVFMAEQTAAGPPQGRPEGHQAGHGHARR